MWYMFSAQIEKLRNEIELQTSKRNALEAQAIGSEKKVQELNMKLESVSIYIFLTELLNNVTYFYLACRVCAVSGSFNIFIYLFVILTYLSLFLLAFLRISWKIWVLCWFYSVDAGVSNQLLVWNAVTIKDTKEFQLSHYWGTVNVIKLSCGFNFV